MSEVTYVAAVVAWGVMPGLALLRLLRLGGSGIEHLAGAAGLSLALVASAAYVAEALGLPIRPLPVALVVGGTLGIVFALRRALKPQAGPPEWPETFQAPRPALVSWLVLFLPLVVVAGLEPVTTFLLLPPSMHDGLDHANWLRLIYETQSLDPHVLLAPPLAADGSPTYYPLGMHAMLALVARTSGLDPMVVLMRGLVLVSAALPLSVYAFVALFTGRGWPALAAGAATLMFWWLPYQVWGWGGYPLLTGAVAALPVSRLALESVRDWHVGGIVAAVLCGFGLLVIHPSQAFGALLVSSTVSVTWALARITPWRAAGPFVVGLALAGVGLAVGPSIWDPAADFMAKAQSVGASLAGDSRYEWPFGLYFRFDASMPEGARVPLGILYVLGAVFALRHRALWPFVALHATGSGLVALAPSHTWVTSLWYHAPERIWYLQYASLPALAALGVMAVLAPLERLGRRWTAWDWRIVLWPVAASLIYAVAYQPFSVAASRQLWLYSNQNPQLTFTDRRVLADFEWIRGHVPPGEVLFNAPADWGLPLPFTGRRTVFWSGGYALDPTIDWHRALGLLGSGDPVTTQAAVELDRLGVHYVYAASLDRRLQVGNRQPLDAEVLKGAYGLELLHESPTASVFRIRAEPDGWLGLHDSDRIRYQGFSDVEGETGRESRRTVAGRVRIPSAGVVGQDCIVRLLGSSFDVYQLRLGGHVLAPTARGFRIPNSYVEQDAVELEVRWVDTGDAGGPAGEPRATGARITDIAFRCVGS